ncbi:hypothetical protein B0H12DRAFT_1122613 [Mycena haematopus]|nr:hypothetical protein B0H12DRAFT_1122613 [Mycena haematopus]
MAPRADWPVLHRSRQFARPLCMEEIRTRGTFHNSIRSFPPGHLFGCRAFESASITVWLAQHNGRSLAQSCYIPRTGHCDPAPE